MNLLQSNALNSPSVGLPLIEYHKQKGEGTEFAFADVLITSSQSVGVELGWALETK